MQIEYKENKTPFPDIPMYSTFFGRIAMDKNFSVSKRALVKAFVLQEVLIGLLNLTTASFLAKLQVFQ